MKNVKIKIVISTLLITTLLVACSVNVVTNNSAPTQAVAVQPTTAAPVPVAPVTPAPAVPAVPVTPVAPQTPQRTVIENGEVIVWAETFNRDETIKPQSIIYEEKGHKIFYNVDGKEIIVAVNEKNGTRYFYKDDTSGGTFAQIGSDVKSSNENILLQVKINDMIIENTKKKYK